MTLNAFLGGNHVPNRITLFHSMTQSAVPALPGDIYRLILRYLRDDILSLASLSGSCRLLRDCAAPYLRGLRCLILCIRRRRRRITARRGPRESLRGSPLWFSGDHLTYQRIDYFRQALIMRHVPSPVNITMQRDAYFVFALVHNLRRATSGKSGELHRFYPCEMIVTEMLLSFGLSASLGAEKLRSHLRNGGFKRWWNALVPQLWWCPTVRYIERQITSEGMGWESLDSLLWRNTGD